MDRSPLFLSALFALLLAAGCGGSGSPSAPETVVVSFTAAPDPVNLTVGQSVTFTLLTTRADGTTALAPPALARYSVILGPETATVSASGVVNGLRAGTARVRITLSGIERDLLVNVL